MIEHGLRRVAVVLAVVVGDIHVEHVAQTRAGIARTDLGKVIADLAIEIDAALLDEPAVDKVDRRLGDRLDAVRPVGSEIGRVTLVNEGVATHHGEAREDRRRGHPAHRVHVGDAPVDVAPQHQHIARPQAEPVAVVAIEIMEPPAPVLGGVPPGAPALGDDEVGVGRGDDDV